MVFFSPYVGVQEPPREKQALATHHEEGATTKMMGDVQLFEGMLQTQHAIAFIKSITYNISTT